MSSLFSFLLNSIIDKKSSEGFVETTINQKKHTMEKTYKEIKKLRSFQEITETMKKLQETLLTKANAPDLSLKEEKKHQRKRLKPYMSAVLKVKIPRETIITPFSFKGFDSSLPKDDIKIALTKHFGSCGEITRVWVPFEYKTGASIGFSFIDMSSGEKNALELSGSYLGGRKLEVMIAMRRPENLGFLSFSGCERCHRAN